MVTKKQKIASLIVCTALILLTIGSCLFIVRAAHHHCIGENCPICAAIENAESAIRELGNGIPPTESVWLPALETLVFVLCGTTFSVLFPTPITQKVRMDD